MHPHRRLRPIATAAAFVISFAALTTIAAAPIRDADASIGSRPAMHSLGWHRLGSVHLTKDGCADKACPLTLTPRRAHRVFALGTDSAFPVGLEGSVTTVCKDGTKLEFLLLSSPGLGISQIVPNACVNLTLDTLTLDVTGVHLFPEDETDGVELTVYASLD
jgi:hypothetical protein